MAVTYSKQRRFNLRSAFSLPIGANFTAVNILAGLSSLSANVDSSILSSEFNSLPTFIRENASMISMLPTASKPGFYYSFDNRPSVGTIIPHTFTRSVQSTGMNKDNAVWLYQVDEPVFEYDNSYETEKQAIIDSINANPNKKLVVNYLPTGYVTDGSVNYASQLNAAVDAGLDVIMPDFPLMVGDTGFTLNSGQRLLFQENSELRIVTGLNGVSYEILSIKNLDNITLINPRIRGDWGNGGLSSISYEYGHGIAISGCRNVNIYDPYCYDCWGDGIYLSIFNSVTDCENINIYNAVLPHNGRNNISITNGIGVMLHEGIFPLATKCNPVAGIDIEPNKPTLGTKNRLTNINILNPITWGNWWSGIQISNSKRYTQNLGTVDQPSGDAVQPFDCYIQNHFSSDDVWAHRLTLDMSTGDVTNQHGTLTFLNPELLNPVTYSPPPGGGSATTTTPSQDGDKAVIKYFLDDPNMIIKYTHPKALLNGVLYGDTQLTNLFTGINMERTTKVVQIP